MVGIALLFFAVISVGFSQDVSADEVPAALVISEIQLRGCITPACTDDREGGFVEVYNNSPVDFGEIGWKIQYVVSNATTGAEGTVTTIAEITEPIGAFEYYLIPHERFSKNDAIGNKSQGYIQLVNPAGEVIDIVGYGSKSILAKGDQPIAAPPTDVSAQRCETESGYLIETGFNATELAQYGISTPGAGIACLASVVANPCTGILLSEIAANTADQFVEIANPTTEPIDLSGCLLQTNRNHNVFTFPDEVLAPGAFRVVRIVDTNLTLTKTTSGTVYILSSDGADEVDSISYANLPSDTSWILHGDGQWRQTYAVTPGEENIWQEYAACDVGYERNPETGRCRKIPVESEPAPCADDQYRNPETGRCKKLPTENELVPCKEGQERNPETNRCRNIDSGNTLVPCKEGQERNPETNRCRNIVATTEPKPCPAGQERNPETGRCRKIIDAAPAAFAVDQAPASRETGLWIWGGVAAVAGVVGYVIWQFRSEIVRSFANWRKSWRRFRFTATRDDI